MGHQLIMWSHYWSLSACPRAKISVEDFGNFQWVHFTLQGGVTHALYCLSVVDINLADLSYDEVSRLGLNIVYLVLISVVKVHFDLIDLVVSRIRALKILIFSLVPFVIFPRLLLVILSRIDFMVLTRVSFMVLPRINLMILATVDVHHGGHLRGLQGHGGGSQVIVCHHGGGAGLRGHRGHCEHTF